MTMTTIDIDRVARVQTKDEATTLATAVNQAFLEDLEQLGESEWEAVTVCAPWSVADMVRHVLGAAKGNASLRELIRQQTYGARHKSEYGGNALDATNALQVEDHRDLTPSQLIEQFRSTAPTSVTKRMSRAAVLGRVGLPLDQTGSTAPGMPARLNMGDLFRVIYTRDVWLHRLDIGRAVGRDPHLDPETDGRVVEDVVKEWADRHRAPFDLTLTGPAGGRYARAGDGAVIELDAAQFCWMLSGRGDAADGEPGSDLLGVRILF